jgi:adenylylsulfate kinase
MATDTQGAEVYRDTQRRTLFKTISWRIIATTTTMSLVWIFTGQIKSAATVGIFEFFSKMLFYYLHERVWNLSSIGKSTAPKSDHVVPHESDVTRAERRSLDGHRFATLWLTGVPGSGKTTLAYALERRLFDRGDHAMVLDGENLRLGLNKDLGFDVMDRSENSRRVAEVAKILNDSGTIAICSLISPFVDDRAGAREILGVHRFIEVYLAGDAEVFLSRARLGDLAAEGRIKNFTGVTGSYEPPPAPEMTLATDRLDVDTCAERVLAFLDERIGATPDA